MLILTIVTVAIKPVDNISTRELYQLVNNVSTKIISKQLKPAANIVSLMTLIRACGFPSYG